MAATALKRQHRDIELSQSDLKLKLKLRYMTEFPFQLLIKRASLKKQTESLTCSALLRVIPGRRQVYDALWNDRSVIVKVFSHKISAKRHLKREWRGLKLLQSRGLSSPVPLFYGKTGDGRWVVVVEEIADSSIVLDVLHKTTDITKKLDLLLLVTRELAKQHDKGVLQKDLHLGNFLLARDKVFALDPGQMRFLPRPVARRTSISQLALLASCYLPAGNVESIIRLCEQYLKARGWEFGKSDKVLFQKQLTAHRKRGVSRGLKKCLRTSRRHLRIKAGRYIAVFDRGFCAGAEPFDFIKQIDALMDAGKILKDGNTCYVARVPWNGKDVVVKRYNHKGFIHSLRHTIKSSRARHSWLNGHQLGMLKIPTPKPMVYIEQLRGPLVWKSYLVTEYVDGQNLDDYLKNEQLSEKQVSEVMQQVKSLIDRMGEHKVIHGDLKHSNILVTPNGLVLTDLDGMMVHKWNWLLKIKRNKDLTRFIESG